MENISNLHNRKTSILDIDTAKLTEDAPVVNIDGKQSQVNFFTEKTLR